MGRVIGIDLGTTNSCVAFFERGEAIVIPNPEGSRTTPSFVSIAEDGDRQIGVVAKRQAVTHPERTLYSVKRLMGQAFASDATTRQRETVTYEVVAADNGDAWVAVDGQALSPPEVSATILRALKEQAESYLGEAVTAAVITVPAYFDDAQRQATKDAGKIAGLNVKRIINEPTAAALAFGLDQPGARQRIAVYDLGGGTFDISILEIEGGVFSVKATAGDTHLGGEDFDQCLIAHIAETFLAAEGADLRLDPKAMQRLKEQAEKAKHELSSSLQTEINLPFICATATGPKHLIHELKRSEFEIATLALVDRTLEPCRQALRDAGLTPDDIDTVLLVGGQTRMPAVRRKVMEFFGKEASAALNPDEVVAMGAALHAASLEGEIDDVLLLDVTPLSLGVETGGGVFHALIERNTTIPTEATEVFTTSLDNQSFVPIHVLQGERPMAADNRSLARFELAPIPPAPRGVPQVEVTFSIDADGLVQVRAKDLGSGKEQNINVVASGGLSAERVESLLREAEQEAQNDAARRELADRKTSAEALIYSTSRALDECESLLDADLVEIMRNDVGYLKALIDAESVDIQVLKDATLQLEQSAFHMAAAIYGDDSEAETSPAAEIAPEDA